ncbi:BTAD domain-containing putative transcriptional regulator [Lentzea sp. NPDC004789]
MGAEYRVLGPLEVLLDGEPVTVPAGRCQVLLAALLLRANRFAPVDELIDLVWDGTPPRLDRAKATLQMVVRRLRVALGEADCVRSAPGGYLAVVEPDQLDLLRFRALADSGDFGAAAALWRGPVLVDVASDALHRAEVRRLADERLVVLERRIEADLERGLAGELVTELRSLVADHPLREPFWRQLMLALYRSGRQAEALNAYQDVRAELVEQLGVEPGEALRDLHERILRADVPKCAKVPRQLPGGVQTFVGRDEELGLLDGPGGVTVVHGVGGVGKTALTLRWAREVRDRFPDGDLYVNLRGFDQEAAPLDPAAVAETLLVGLGVTAVPADEDARFALLRTEFADRRMLLVLDNAASVRQVVPLLPGSAGVRVLITSRNQLRALVSRHDATAIGLRQLAFDESRALLAAVLGEQRLRAEPEAVREIADRCAGLPLALRVFSERVARFPDISLREFVSELDSARLDALSDFDDVDVRSVFSWSYRALDDDSARMFRLLSLHPGPDLDVSAAAALAGVSVVQARRTLERLVADHLVQSRTPGRYDLHDLLRAYSAELCGDDEAAALRLTEFYVHTLENAATHEGSRMLTRAGEVTSGVVPREFSSRSDALAWVRQEWDNFQAVAHQAIARGWGRLGMVVAAHMHSYLLFTKTRCNDAISLFEVARSHGTPREQGFMLLKLAAVYDDVGRLEESLRCFDEGLRFAHEAGERVAEAASLINMAGVHRRLGNAEDAVDCARRGLEIALELADPYYESAARANVALQLRVAGRLEEALAESERALVVAQDLDDKFMRANVRGLHARILGQVGRLDEAVSELSSTIEVSFQFGDVAGAAEGLRDLGKFLVGLGRPDDAAEAWRRALTTCRDLDGKHAEEITALLEGL